MADATRIDVLDTIQGTSFLSIEAAMPVARKRLADVSRYDIEVARHENSALVIFTDADRRSGSLATIAVRPEGPSELDARSVASLLSNPEQKQRLDTIHGASLPAVEAAVREFERHRPEIAQYKIDVVRDRDAIVVVFADQHRPEGTKGSVGNRPGFEVEMNASDLRIRRSYFVR
jgi:hypothetical protein